jgi:hypothetical protein
MPNRASIRPRTGACQRRPTSSPPLALLVAALAATTACGSAPDFERELTTTRSWIATVRLAAEERRAGAIPRRYTLQLRDRAAEALFEEREKLAHERWPADDASRARGALDSLESALRALDATVDGR